MKFECKACRVILNVPEEKIPAGREVRFLCPKCKNPVESFRSGANSTASEEPVGDSFEGELERCPGEHASPVEFIEEGVRTALLFGFGRKTLEKMEGVLGWMEFHVSVAADVKEALDKLHVNRYDLVLIEDVSAEWKGGDRDLLFHIQELPMHIRRQLLLGVVSETAATMDHLAAFRMGADLLINKRDMDKARVIIERAIKDYRLFYHVYKEELGKRGAL